MLKIAGVRDDGKTAFRSIDECIRNNAALQAAGVRVVSFRDGEGNDAPLTGPSIKLIPSGGGMGWITEGQHETRMTVDVILRVLGTNYDDLCTLWQGVLNCLYAPPGAVRDRIDAIRDRVGALDIIDLQASAWPGVDEGDSLSPNSLTGSAQLIVTFWTSTQE